MISVSKYFNHYHRSLVVKLIKLISICSTIFMRKLAGVFKPFRALNMILKNDVIITNH